MSDRALEAVVGLVDGVAGPLLAGEDDLDEGVGAGWSAAGDTGQTLQNLQKQSLPQL